MGFDAVCENMQAKQAQILFFANDISPKTRRRIQEHNVHNIPVYTLPYTKQQLTQITNKPVGVLVVSDEGLAKMCENTLPKMPAQPLKEEPI